MNFKCRLSGTQDHYLLLAAEVLLISFEIDVPRVKKDSNSLRIKALEMGKCASASLVSSQYHLALDTDQKTFGAKKMLTVATWRCRGLQMDGSFGDDVE